MLVEYRFRRSALIDALEPLLGALDEDVSAREFATVVADLLAETVVLAKQGDELVRYVAHGLEARLSALRALEPQGVEALATARRLSTRAGRDAVQVGEAVDRQGTRSALRLDQALWVQRDLEEEVLTLLADAQAPCIVVEGLPGMGKTSLLWRLQSLLVERPEQEPLFIKAAVLLGAKTSVGAATPVLTTRDLRRAAASARALGRQATVLLDTVDVLLHTDSGRELVVDLIESLRAEGAAVVAACRGREARELRSVRSDSRRLGAYVDAELEDAVRRHVLRFYGEQDTDDVANQVTRLRGMVARREPVGELLRTPLLLRMVFELYAPYRIEGELHAFRLYEEYWDRRVRRDMRSEQGPAVDPTDLTAVAGVVAAHMLATGEPELDGAWLEGALRARRSQSTAWRRWYAAASSSVRRSTSVDTRFPFFTRPFSNTPPGAGWRPAADHV